MTYKEYVAEKCPHRVDINAFGGMKGCPGTDGIIKNGPICGACNRSPGDYNCSDCWNTEIPEEKKEEHVIDINKIIDDAMEKKDRTVSIYIGRIGTTINVQPYEMEGPKHWIHNHSTGYSECPECGNEIEPDEYNDFRHWPNYCCECGEKLGLPKDEEEHSPLAHPETYVSDAIAMINDMTDAQRAEVMNHLEWIRNGYPKETEVESDG